MLRSFLINDITSARSEYCEGELFKTITIEGETFNIHYGYYEECDRSNPDVDPMPIYPDFIKNPRYTKNGFPFVTMMQDACSYYKGRETKEKDCAECRHYTQGEELIGVCTCYEKKLKSENITDFNYTREERK